MKDGGKIERKKGRGEESMNGERMGGKGRE